jgi:porphobilinogen synthase
MAPTKRSARNTQIRQRPRRNRVSEAVRSLVRETEVLPSDLILPLFVMDGKNEQKPITSMPGQFRFTRDRIVATAKRAQELGISAVALFPLIKGSLKDTYAKESLNPDGLLQRTVRDL